MNKFLQYVKHSNIHVSLSLNPFKWRVYIDSNRRSDMDPGLLLDFIMILGPLKIAMIIDDGSW